MWPSRRAAGVGLSTWARIGDEPDLMPVGACATADRSAYRGYRFPEIIAKPFWLYFRFHHSFRDLQDLLAEPWHYRERCAWPRAGDDPRRSIHRLRGTDWARRRRRHPCEPGAAIQRCKREHPGGAGAGPRRGPGRHRRRRGRRWRRQRLCEQSAAVDHARPDVAETPDGLVAFLIGGTCPLSPLACSHAFMSPRSTERARPILVTEGPWNGSTPFWVRSAESGP